MSLSTAGLACDTLSMGCSLIWTHAPFVTFATLPFVYGGAGFSDERRRHIRSVQDNETPPAEWYDKVPCPHPTTYPWQESNLRPFAPEANALSTVQQGQNLLWTLIATIIVRVNEHRTYRVNTVTCSHRTTPAVRVHDAINASLKPPSVPVTV